MELGDHIRTLDRALKDHIRRWERFFAGDLRVPPVDDRERIARRLRWLAEQPTTRHEDRFRINQLQHRFQAHAQNWERMLREREEGRGRFAEPSTAAAPSTGPPPTVPDGTPARAVPESGAGDLFERYVDAKRSLGQDVAIDRDAFEARIGRQRQALTERLGTEVRFDVVVEGGKVKLAARRHGPATKEST